MGVVESDGDDAARLTTGSDDLDNLAGHLVSLGLPFEALEPPELRDLLRRTAKAIAAAHR